MAFWMNLLVMFQVVIGLAIIGLVLLQHGKGADMGSGFGGGSSGSLFGATGSANFLSRTTAALATLFFVSSLVLGYLVSHRPKQGAGVMSEVKTAPASAKPAAQSSKPAAQSSKAAPAVPQSSKAKNVPN